MSLQFPLCIRCQNPAGWVQMVANPCSCSSHCFPPFRSHRLARAETLQGLWSPRMFAGAVLRPHRPVRRRDGGTTLQRWTGHHLRLNWGATFTARWESEVTDQSTWAVIKHIALTFFFFFPSCASSSNIRFTLSILLLGELASFVGAFK